LEGDDDDADGHEGPLGKGDHGHHPIGRRWSMTTGHDDPILRTTMVTISRTTMIPRSRTLMIFFKFWRNQPLESLSGGSKVVLNQ